MKEMYKDISMRQDQNFILMENDTMLSREDNQGGAHAHLVNEETRKQSEEFFVEDMMEENEDSMIVLSPWNENIKSLESEFANKEHKIDVVEGDIFKDIQEVWVEAIYIVVPREISGVTVESKVEKLEESIHQVENEGTEYDKKWKSNKRKIFYQLKDVFEMEIEELW